MHFYHFCKLLALSSSLTHVEAFLISEQASVLVVVSGRIVEGLEPCSHVMQVAKNISVSSALLPSHVRLDLLSLPLPALEELAACGIVCGATNHPIVHPHPPSPMVCASALHSWGRSPHPRTVGPLWVRASWQQGLGVTSP